MIFINQVNGTRMIILDVYKRQEIESISEGSIMCGRYYIDSDMADEIEKVVHDIDQRIRQEHFAGDIFPTNVAPIIEKSEHGLKLDV